MALKELRNFSPSVTPPAPPNGKRDLLSSVGELPGRGDRGQFGDTCLEEEEERFLEEMREGGNSEVLATSPYPPGAWV